VTSTAPGRRERKKAATRQALADSALALFLERGFDRVTVAEIADAADVSVATLFKHYPSKEALLFDRDTDREEALTAAVRDRESGVSILDALRALFLSRTERPDHPGSDDLERFRALVAGSPGLGDYMMRMWARHTDALARVVAEDLGLPAPTPAVRALAYLVVQAPGVGRGVDVDVREQLDAYFALLGNGWDVQEAALRSDQADPMPGPG
jgi:AcrR family transcriptional regulator